MPSVNAVSAAEFRAGLSQSQNFAPEGDDAFSDLLHSVTEAKTDARRPDAPQVPERRADAPAKPPKPEADADRQAKRRAADETKPEANAKQDTPAVSGVADEQPADEESDAATDADDADANALLMLGLATQQQDAVDPALAADVQAAAEVAAKVQAPEVPEAAVPQAPAVVPQAMDVTDAMQASSMQAPSVQNAKVLSARATAMGLSAGAAVEIQIPQRAAEMLASLARPIQAVVSDAVEAQPQAASASQVQIATAQAAQVASPLETLNAAISKHLQLSLHGDPRAETPPETQKPLISSNAVAPNFAMTAQLNAPMTAQAQTAAEAARAVPVEQLAVEIATRAGKGERRFDIRLDPPELGRIDVRLEIDSKGNTTTKLIVERAETLDLLQRDARGLEKALQNAGLKTDAGGLQFSLQQDSQTQQGQHNHAPDLRGRPQGVQAEAEIITEIATGNASLAAQLRGGVDIRI